MILATIPDRYRTTISETAPDLEQAHGAAVLIDAEREDEWPAILETLALWSGQYSPLAQEDDIDPPSPFALKAASDLARAAYAQGIEVPDAVVVTGDGGLAFEYRTGQETDVYEIMASGALELVRLDGGRLVERKLF